MTFLDGVFCTAVKNCWAVGGRGNISTEFNLIMHWNGKTWRRASVPSPGGTGSRHMSVLDAVRCLTAKDCWAVGIFSKGAATFAQALHWNGRRWSITRTPDPAGTAHGDVTELFDSTCTSAGNCWAVGDFGMPLSRTLNLVLHWNGKKWSRLRVVNPAGSNAGHLNTLAAIRCLSVANCIADGDYGTGPGATGNLSNQALHWNGKKWSRVVTPNPGGPGVAHQSVLTSLGCGAANSCWGTGYYGAIQPGGNFLNEILRWNGKKWSKAVAPNPGGISPGSFNQLYGTTCSSSRNCWAVGVYTTKTGDFDNEAVHWNGRRWWAVSTSDPPGSIVPARNILLAVRCTSTANCWAVGYAEPGAGSLQSEILHWNGKKWSLY